MASVWKKRGNVNKKKTFGKDDFSNSRKRSFRCCSDLREEGQYFQRKKPKSANESFFRGHRFQKNKKFDDIKQQNRTYPSEVESDDIYERFDRISETLKAGFNSDLEKEMFLANILEEINGNEVELSCSKTTSHTMEMILAVCEDSVILMKIVNAFSSSLRQLCTNQYGSHVIESLLSCGMKIMKKYSEMNSNHQENKEEPQNHKSDVTSWILKFGKFCLNNVEHFLGHIYASHILRTLVEVWSGVKVEEGVRQSKRSLSQKRKFQSSEENAIHIKPNNFVEPSEVEVPEEFVSQLKEFYQKITQLGNLIDCCVDAQVSPILQTLVIGLQKRAPKLCQKFIKLLLKNVIVWEDKEKIPIALTNKSSSCVIEKVILAADEKRQKWIWKHCFKNYMKLLVLHRIANFIIQKFFAGVQGKEQFEEMFNEVSPHFEDILSAGHNGVIVSIAEACVRLGICQAQFMQTTMKVLQCLEPEERQLYLAPLVIHLSTYSTFEESEKMSQSSVLSKDLPISYHGSLLLQHMLRFHKPVKVVKSILFLKDDLKQIACHAKGSYIIESFLTGTHVGEKNREKLIHVLKPHLMSLACDKFGSRVLDSIWITATLKQKTLISEELVSKESELNSTTFGYHISKKFGLHYFKTRRNDWNQMQSSDTKKRKMFNDILS